MSKLNLVDGLFIGKEELSAFQKFCNTDFKTLLGLMTYDYGFVDLANRLLNTNLTIANMDSFKVSSTDVYKIQIQNPSYIFSYPNNLITWDKNESIIIPDTYAGTKIWIKVSYEETHLEKGTITLSSNGAAIGVGTEFSQKLRGEPNFPSRITLFAKDSSGNFISKKTYFVTSVNSDISLQLNSFGGIDDINYIYYYAVAGTFPEGALVNSSDQYPFRYDSCKVEFVAENSEGTPPNEALMQESNTEFYIARLAISDSGVITVEDKRDVFSSFANKAWTLKNK